jgi:HAD superfamily phosphoserine phosphatase-like hydrolase
MLEVFVDFDGTITDVDTFDVLVRAVAGDEVWNAIDEALHAGTITLRDALAQQAAAVCLTRPQTLAFMETHTKVDPAFGSFVAAVRAHGGTIRVLSAGIAAVIEDALARSGVEVDVLANDVDFSPAGWTMATVSAISRPRSRPTSASPKRIVRSKRTAANVPSPVRPSGSLARSNARYSPARRCVIKRRGGRRRYARHSPGRRCLRSRPP